MIFVTSDFHFNHNKDFIYGKRGFENVDDMNQAIINAVNNTVGADDELYILGDLMLGNLNDGLNCMKQINCKNLYIVYGNHDTDTRKQAYWGLPQNIVEAGDALTRKYCGLHFYFSHYPTLTGNIQKESLSQMTLNIHGHTHQSNVFMDKDQFPFMFHAGVDSAPDFMPWSLDQIIYILAANYKEIQAKEKQ